MARKKARASDDSKIRIGEESPPFFYLNKHNLSEKQKDFVDLALDPEVKIMLINGPAGSTKTYVAIYAALRLLSQNSDLDLLYARTIIESADRNMGALPGTADEKFNPYMLPLLDKLEEFLKPSDCHRLFAEKRIEALPVNFLRGANWINKIVVADEAQNFTFKELTTLITRIGEDTKLFVCGDFMQSDINGKSGYRAMCDRFCDDTSKKMGIHTFKFGIEDIKRSRILKYIVKRLEETN
jgi:phosphate starvation-inducible PhoH-like protein|tara:strand:- start:19786 stop:20505 length:720 start_codon:yes stop_codon:yes gene_type:complete